MLDLRYVGTKCKKYLFMITDTIPLFCKPLHFVVCGIMNRIVNTDWSQVNKYVVVIIVIKN